MLKRQSGLFKMTTFRISLCISFLLLVLVFFKEQRGWEIAWFDLMELKALDVKFLDRGERPEHGQVAIAAIDERSMEAYGRFPWNRIIIAQLIAKLAQAQAKVIAFDINFTDRDQSQLPLIMKAVAEQVGALQPPGCENDACEPLRAALVSELNTQSVEADPDRILSDTIEQAGNVILGFWIFNDRKEVAQLDQKRLREGLQLLEPSRIGLFQSLDPEAEKDYPLQLPKSVAARAPLPVFAKATEAFGHFSFIPDTDGALRWGSLIKEVENPTGNVHLIYPSLSLKAASMMLDSEIVLHTYPGGVDSITLGLGEQAVRIPTDSTGRLLINYYGRMNVFPTYSVLDILQGKIDPEQFKDKVVLVGATAIGLYDLRVTPFQENFPGVEIHASIIDNILNRNFLARPYWGFGFELALILFFGVLFGIMLGRLPALWGALFTIFVLGTYYQLDKHLFFANGHYVRSVLPLTQAFVIFLVCYVYRYVTEEREKKRTRAAFTQYLHKDVVDSVMQDFDRLKLGGEKRDITVMFCDIRSFTSFSEKLSPESLGQVLTEYFNPMTDIIFENRGVLDKYIGDCIMAFWGAPQPNESQAELACRTSLDMLVKLEELNQTWNRRGLPPLDIGIGLNSGPMWVGNMGSHVRFDYTVIGDHVNLSSRLEGTNKQYGTHVIISEFTYAQIKDRFVCRELDSIRVKGKKEPVTIYELLADNSEQTDLEPLVQAFERGLTLYRRQQWSEAIKAFHDVLLIRPDDRASKLFVDRCHYYQTQPPSADWDGVYTMTTK